MSRFFLHIRDRSTLIEDPEGADFTDLPAAIEEAAASARDLMAENLKAAQPLGLDRAMVISDEQGRNVATVSFRAAIPPSKR
jgi:hypothetical protein